MSLKIFISDKSGNYDERHQPRATRPADFESTNASINLAAFQDVHSIYGHMLCMYPRIYMCRTCTCPYSVTFLVGAQHLSFSLTISGVGSFPSVIRKRTPLNEEGINSRHEINEEEKAARSRQALKEKNIRGLH